MDLLKNYIDQDLVIEFAHPCFCQNKIVLNMMNSLIDYAQVH